MDSTNRIIQTFSHINRKDFVLPKYKNEAYGDYPLSIGYGQTISQPSTVAFMLKLLNPSRGDKILDVGSGSGWTTALLAYLVGDKGKVIGIELIPELVELGRKNLQKYKFTNAQIFLAQKELGYKKEALYDKILVSAAVPKLPQQLLGQLKPKGIMVVPIQNALWKITKTREYTYRKGVYPGFVFVPLKTQSF